MASEVVEHPPTARSRSRRDDASSDVWQARVPEKLSEALLVDMGTLGVATKSDLLRLALERLHREAEEVRLAREFDDFYGDTPPPLGVLSAAMSEDDQE